MALKPQSLMSSTSMEGQAAHFVIQVTYHLERYNMARHRVGIDDPVPGTRQGPPQVVDRHGEPIRLTTYQKNALYRQAKAIKAEMQEKMCTRRETHKTDERTVNKMYHSEFARHDKMKYYHQAMTAIGADTRERDLNNYRRKG